MDQLTVGMDHLTETTDHLTERTAQLMDTMNRLANIVIAHEERIEDLEKHK